MGPQKCEQIVKTVSDLGWKDARVYPSSLSEDRREALAFSLLFTESLDAYTLGIHLMSVPRPDPHLPSSHQSRC